MYKPALTCRSLRLVVALAMTIWMLTAAAPASAIEMIVYDETGYRNALQALSADETGPHTIVLGNDITLASAATPTYSGTRSLTIQGKGYTLDGGGNSRVLYATSGAGDVTFIDTTITGGRFSGGGAGGGVWLRDGALTLIRTTVTGNTAPGNDGGGVAAGRLLAVDSVISGNTAGDDAGGAAAKEVTLIRTSVIGNVANGYRGEGGGVFGDNVTAIRSTITGNRLTRGAGGVGGGGVIARGPLTLIRTTVSDNSGPNGSNVRVWDNGNGSGLRAVWATIE
ncbi:MAG: pectate lyase-like adhesive domain-containing protein, partial [Acidimicrobiia bacterium]|nr:pectate lyase-like adhesive domain-containing protein [Acidimicrobiia bacterium]